MKMSLSESNPQESNILQQLQCISILNTQSLLQFSQTSVLLHLFSKSELQFVNVFTCNKIVVSVTDT